MGEDLIAAEGRPEPGSRVAVAYSGGMDSSVLLHLLHAEGRYALRALHVHHGLQPDADEWARHCQGTCERLGVPCQVVKVEVSESGQGLEGAAREARYAAFRTSLQPDEILAMGHHLEDQAETVLLQLLRGGGLRGLAAMTVRRDLAPGSLWRPLLDTPRDRLRRYALQHRLAWLEDPHNESERFARSYLRSEVMPHLSARWPGASANLARAARLGREAATLMDALADEDIGRLRGTRPPGTLPIAALKKLDAPRRRNVVRRWLEGLGLPSAYFDTLRRLDEEVLEARPDAEPVLAWPGAEMRRYRDALYAMPTLPPAPSVSIDWTGEGPLALPDGCGGLEGAGVGPCIVRLPVPVSRFRPAGDPLTRALKNLYQSRGIPPWVRVRTPAVERAGTIVWIGGIGWARDVLPARALTWTGATPAS